MKTPTSHTIPAIIARTFGIGVLALSGAVLVLSVCVPPLVRVQADTYDTQIKTLQQQNAAAQAAVNDLKAQAETYQDAISQLQQQINSLQVSINANEAEQASLQQQIIDAQNQIDRERAVLATDIKTMYVDGTPTTLEILANSKNLSDFVDKQEYRTTVQNKLQDSLKKIAELQKQLQTKKAQVEQLLSELQTQQAQVDSDRSQQQKLLNYNKAQQNDYTSQLKANNTKMAQLRAAQAAAIAKVTGTGGSSATGASVKYKNFTTSYSKCGGEYSYCWAGYDQIVSDPWGLNYAHECVHYVADYLTRIGKHVPNMSGAGNANKWINYGTLVSDPQYGDVVYMPLDYPGHVGIVESVNSDGTVHVSQMNWPIGGYYSEMDLYITPGVQFIRFN